MLLSKPPADTTDSRSIAQSVETLMRSPVLRKAAIYGARLVAVFQLLVWLPHLIAHPVRHSDMWVYYTAFQAILSHRSPYTFVPGFGPDQFDPVYVYPPQFAILLSPLGRLSFHTFAGIWSCLLVGLVWLYAYLLAGLTQKRRTLDGVVVWVTAIMAFPNLEYVLSYGQCDLVIAVGLCAFVASSYRSPAAALVTSIKPYVALALPMAFARERRISISALWPFALWLVGCWMIPEWLHDGLGLLSQGLFVPDNVSLSFAVLRLSLALHLWRYPGGPLPAPEHSLLGLLAIAGPCVTVLLLRRLKTPHLCVAATLATAAFAPVCWEHYFVSIYISIALLIRDFAARVKTGGVP